MADQRQFVGKATFDGSAAVSGVERLRAAYREFLEAVAHGKSETEAARASFAGLFSTAEGGIPSLEQFRLAASALGVDLSGITVAAQSSATGLDVAAEATQGHTADTQLASRANDAATTSLVNMGQALSDAASANVGTTASLERGADSLNAYAQEAREAADGVAELRTEAQRADGPLDRLSDNASSSIGRWSRGKVGVVEYARAVYNMAEGQAEGEGRAARLTVAIERQGGVAGEYKGRIDGLIAAGERLGITDDSTRESLIQTIGTLHDVKLGFQATAVAMDMTAERGGTLESNTAALVGMMATGGQRAERWGIQVREGATAYEVLQAAQARYSGASVAFAATQEASFKRVDVAVDELKDTYGEAANTIIPLLNEIGSAALDNFTKLEESTFEGVGSSYAATFELIKGVFEGEGIDTDKFAQRMEELRGRLNGTWQGVADDSEVSASRVADAFSQYSIAAHDNFAGFDFSGTLADQMALAEAAAETGTDRVLDILNIGDDADGAGGESGDAWTGAILSALEAGLPGAGTAAAHFVSALDKSDQSATVGEVIGSALVNAASSRIGSGMRGVLSNLEAQMNQALAALGSSGIKLPTSRKHRWVESSEQQDRRFLVPHRDLAFF